MRYELGIYNIWEFGQRVDADGNPHQEDNIFPAYQQQKDSDRLFILCDGMGGHEAGEVASSAVCAAMSKSVFDHAQDSEGEFSDDILRQAIADAFDALDALPQGDAGGERKMGTTMTVLKFHSQGCTIAHMGDSRVYHIRPGKGREDTTILFQTSDHSLVNDLIKVGELTPEEAKLSKQKNVITRAMQPGMERRPKADIYHTADIKPGDYFYMCSDGMLEQMEDENIAFNFSEATGDDENKVKILTQATSQNSDNHSAIIIHVLDVIDPQPLEEKPVAPRPAVVKPEPIMAEVEDESNNPGKATPDKNTEKGNTRLWLYVSLASVLLLLAVALFFVCNHPLGVRAKNPDKTETPHKQSPNTKRNKTKAQSPQEPSEKLSETKTQDEPASGAQLEEPNPDGASASEKIQDVVSSHTNPSGTSGQHGDGAASGEMWGAIDAVNNGSQNSKK